MNICILLTNKEVDCFSFSPSNVSRLQNYLPGAEIINCRNEKSFIENLGRADIAMVWVFRQEWFRLAPNLKWIATPAAGKDFFKVELPDGVIKTHGSFHGLIMAETILGMMLSFSRGIITSYYLQDKSSWPRAELCPLLDILRGKNLLIIGFGSIGLHIARLAKAFGMNVTGVKRKLTEKPEFMGSNDDIITINDLNDHLHKADHVVLALPAEESTNDIMNKMTIGLMKKTAYLYNIGRGNSINENDLAECLKNKCIQAAFLDVFRVEPLPADSPLRSCPNLYIMPHASAISPQYMDFFIDDFMDKFKNLSMGI